MTESLTALCNDGSMRTNNLDRPSLLTQRELEAILQFNERVGVER